MECTYTYDGVGNQLTKHEVIGDAEKGTTIYTYNAEQSVHRRRAGEDNDNVTICRQNVENTGFTRHYFEVMLF